MLRSGIDLIEIARIRRAIDAHGDRFLGRVFTATEIEQSCGRHESLAARFAVKEAVAKALGTGVWRNGINWTDIETCRDPLSGAPKLRLYNGAAAQSERLELAEWSISLSHDRTYAVACAVAL